MMSKTRITKAEAIYTGGNIWIFYGELADGNYFLCDDNGWARFLSEDPRIDFEESCYEDWQEERLVRDLEGRERELFCWEMIDWLKAHPEDRGGMTELEMESYRTYLIC